MPPVMKKHYANRPFTSDRVTAKGVMEIKIHWLIKLFAPLFNLTGTLVAKQGDNIEVTVRFESDPNSTIFCLNREFSFRDGSKYQFISRMEPVGSNEVIEWTSSGIGWRAAYAYDGTRITLRHRAYCIRLFGTRISLPLSLIFGKTKAEEKEISGNAFEMAMHIHHPILGTIYSYGGTFEITDMKLDE